MIRSFAFTTQGRLHSKDIETFLMPTLLADTNLFLWVDLEQPTPEETKFVLEDIFHFHPLSIEDCVVVSPSPKVEEYTPKENWLGGFLEDGKPVRTLATLKAILGPHFQFCSRRDLPFLIREHARKFQWSVAEASVWIRK